ncbi:MAG: WD40/YVTN/BNR-like repeat-containing protein [Phycisphaerae bacterium]
MRTGTTMTKHVLTAVLVLCGIAVGDTQTATGPNYGWEPVGLSGGGATYRPSISPHDPNLILLSCDMRNTFRTDNGGKSWEMLDMNMISTCTESQACFHPKDPGLVYWGSGLGLMQSNDKGRTWQKVPGTPAWGTVNRMYISKANPSLYLAGCARGVWISRDAGKSWEACAGITGQILAFLEVKGALFAATVDGVFRSDDDGKTWSLKDKGLAKAKTKDFSGGEKEGKAVIYCLQEKPNLRVMRSVDKGETWEPAMGGLGDLEYHRILCAESEPDVAYLNNMGQGSTRYDIYKTTDAGKTWKNCYRLGGTGNVEYGWMDYAPGFGKEWTGRFKRGFRISLTDSNVVVGCNSAEVYITRDGGKTWSQLYCIPVGKPSKDAKWMPNGFMVTSNWLYSIDPTDKNRHYISYTDIGFAYSEDGGKSWTQSIRGSPWRNTVYYIAFDPGRPGTIYGAASDVHDLPFAMRPKVEGDGGIIKSEDYGKTWARLGTGLPSNPMTSIVKDPKSLFVAAMGDGVYRSDDDGKTWARKSSGLGKSGNMNVYYLKFDKKGNIYCSITRKKDADGISETQPGGLFKSEDRGETWVCLKETGNAMDFDFDPTNDQVIYLAAYDTTISKGKVAHNGGIYKTADGGKSWEKLAVTDRKFADYIVFGCVDVAVHPTRPELVFASWKSNEPAGGIVFSGDKGKTWKEFSKCPFISPTRLTLDGDTAYVTTFGSGVWKKKLPDRSSR